MNLARELPRYSLVSVVTMVLRLGVATALFYGWEWFEDHYIVAVALGYLCQISAEATINPRWTFRKEGVPWWKAFAITTLVEAMCFVQTACIVFVLREDFGFSFLAAQAVAVPVTGLFSYWAMSRYMERFS